MLKHRFIPYIVGVGIVVLTAVSYFGYREYQDYVELQANLSDAQALNHLGWGQHDYSSHDHMHHGEGAPIDSDSEKPGAERQTDSGHEHPYFVGRTPDGNYAYNIAGYLYTSKAPMSQRSIEIQEWIRTGKMTSGVQEAIETAEELREEATLNVIQTVVTPNGQLHHVIVPRWEQYEEGDAILESELAPPEIEGAALAEKPWLNNKTEIDGVWHSYPEAYYSIEDPYERREYGDKFRWSIRHGISMAEVEKKAAQGELDFSLTEDEKRMIEQREEQIERSKLLAFAAPSFSDKPPVKVSFLPDDAPDALPGWVRKGEVYGPSGAVIHSPLGRGEAVSDGDYSEAAPFSDGDITEDTSGAPVRPDVPVSPSDLPGGMVKPQSPQSVKGIEAELSKRVSTGPVDKAQRLIDQYGTEEGLRRLRESDPEAARQFESDPDSIEDAENRHKSRSRRVGTGRERRPVPSRDVSDGGQPESGSTD